MTSVTIIRDTGAEEHFVIKNNYLINFDVRRLIDADVLDFVNLRDGRTMAVDDQGHRDGRPVNEKATKMYHAVCRPGTTHQICGDVAIFKEDNQP